MEIENLVTQISAINKRYEGIAEITGEDFNIFQIINYERNELMHSKFLAELLNPRGRHGQKDKFLKIFVKKFNFREKDYKTDEAKATAEVNAGLIPIDYTTGGRIDIVVNNEYNKKIIIENKIDAGDQRNQLFRYHKYDDTADLFYLTLNGKEPSTWSTEILKKKEHFECLSYETDIRKWLEECKKEAIDLPLLRETITQYINLIKILTNQTTNKIMENEIVEKITNSPENIKAAFIIEKSISEIKSKIISLLFEALNDGYEEGLWEFKTGKEPPYSWVGFCYKPNKKYHIYIRLLDGHYYQIDLLIYFDEKPDRMVEERLNPYGKLTDKVLYKQAYIANDELINIHEMKNKINKDVKKIVELLKDVPDL